MQLALNYGKAYYLSTPILTIEEALDSYPVLEKEAILDSLILDLESIQYVQNPDYGDFGSSFYSTYYFLSARFLLADLYLWKNEYAKAASKYFELALDEGRSVTPRIHQLGVPLRHPWCRPIGMLFLINYVLGRRLLLPSVIIIPLRSEITKNRLWL